MYPALDNLNSLSDFNVPNIVGAKVDDRLGVKTTVAKEVQSVVVPLTNAQIATLYHNPQLQANTEFVEAFLQVTV